MKSRHYLGMIPDIVELLLACAIEPVWIVFVTLIEKLDEVQEVKRRRYH